MKRTITITAAAILGLAGFALTASAHEEEEYVQRGQPVDERGDYRLRDDARRNFDPRDGSGQLDREVSHLNGMVAHVRNEMREYGGDRNGHLRSEFRHVRAECDQLNNRFRRGAQYYDRRRVRAEVEHMHNELHHLEQELHVRADGYYQWR